MPDAAASGAGRNSKLKAENWIGALKQGRTFFTSGPLLELTVDTAGPGDTVNLPATGGQVVVKAQVELLIPALLEALASASGPTLYELALLV